MLRRLRAGVAEVLELFVGDWLSTALAVLVLLGGWALAQRVHGAAVGFAMAGALALLIVGAAVLQGRARRGAG
jgi:hypothetical protein